MSIKVAVRVRPFSQREINNESSSLCIEMSGKTTIIKDKTKKTNLFNFDYSLWSHDNFAISENGYFEALTDKYCDQQRVFDLIGNQIIKNSWEGYNTSLIANGQNGSGKTYSMFGDEKNQGIVPRICNELFKKIKSQSSEKSYEVCISMLEIHNEKINDLLITKTNKKISSKGLKIRENKSNGIFIDGISKIRVSSLEEINQKIDEGLSHRTFDFNQMNPKYTNSNYFINIYLKQVETRECIKSEINSILNFGYLSGSQRVYNCGPQNSRLKAISNINKSLLVLGKVINSLKDKNIAKVNSFPNFRESTLTLVLKNALSGNSKTFILCGLSPSSIWYEESLSTLRMAEKAKKIQNKTVIISKDQSIGTQLAKLENRELKEIKETMQGLDLKLLKNIPEIDEGVKINIQELKDKHILSSKESDEISDQKSGLNLLKRNLNEVIDKKGKIDDKPMMIDNSNVLNNKVQNNRKNKKQNLELTRNHNEKNILIK